MRYQANLPYPVVSGLKQNRKQAMMLMEGYSGRGSELTTVTQYAYHKLRCENTREIYDTLQGIFLVETHHLELLGRCVYQLGVDPRYNMYINEKQICWQPEVIDYEDSLQEMISVDIEGEKHAAEYYTRTAETINNERIAVLLLRLAEDEKLHVRIFSDIYSRYFRN